MIEKGKAIVRHPIRVRIGRVHEGDSYGNSINDFRITQTDERLSREGTIGQTNATGVHHEVGEKVRNAIQDIGGTMPEALAPEPSIKPMLEAKYRKRKKLASQSNRDDTITGSPPQDT